MTPLRRLALFFGFLMGVCAVNAQTPEEKLKAAFVYNFAKFITWPSTTFASRAHITICVVGKGGGIEEALAPLASRTAQGKTIVLRLAAAEDAMHDCEVAYIASSERARMSSILKELAANSVLTVSDADKFAQSGGMIGLVTEGNKVVFEVNLDALNKAGLKVNAQLLKVAKTVYQGKT